MGQVDYKTMFDRLVAYVEKTHSELELASRFTSSDKKAMRKVTKILGYAHGLRSVGAEAREDSVDR